MKNKTSTKHTLIISVKPRFADPILTGEKTYELRRIKPNIKKDDRILLYVTAPRKELIEEECEKDNPNGLELSNVQGDIAFNNVSFKYDDGNHILNNISFKILDLSVKQFEVGLFGSMIYLQDRHLFESREFIECLFDLTCRHHVC